MTGNRGGRRGSGNPSDAVAGGPGARRGSEHAGAAGSPDAAAGNPDAAAKSICLRLLTGQSRSRSELAAKLHERGIPDDVAVRVLDRLTDVGLIDDAAYAEAFVASRQRSRGLGRSALRRELERKGIDRSLADQAVQTVDDDAERSRAADLVAKKLDSAMFAGTDAARRRLLGMLARRGYSSTVAIGVVNDAMRGYSEPMDQLTDSGSDTAFDA